MAAGTQSLICVYFKMARGSGSSQISRWSNHLGMLMSPCESKLSSVAPSGSTPSRRAVIKCTRMWWCSSTIPTCEGPLSSPWATEVSKSSSSLVSEEEWRVFIV